MTEFVIIHKNQKPTILGRDLHKALEIKTDYGDWFCCVCKYGFVEGRDFTTLKLERLQCDVDRIISCDVTDHLLSLDAAKEICLLQKTEIGKRCRGYILDIEQRHSLLLIPSTAEFRP